MTKAEELASFVLGISYEELSEAAREQLKLHTLDAVGCAAGALENPTMQAVRALVNEFDGHGRCPLIGGGAAPPDHAAFYNGALVR